MIRVWSNWFPFGSFEALTAWPFLFLRRDKEITEVDIRHEKIHGAQQGEMMAIGAPLAGILAFFCGWWSLLALPLFYWMYGVCWVIEFVRCLVDKERGQASVQYRQRNLVHRIAHAIIFEREAYIMQSDETYLKHRSWYAWKEFIGVNPI